MPLRNRRKFLKRLIWTIIIGFVLMNIIAIFHSYKFTHFADSSIEKTVKPEKLSLGGKLEALFLGVNNPRPVNQAKPSGYESFVLQSNSKIECWYLKKQDSLGAIPVKGTVILCHGYGGEKSSLLNHAAIFDSLGYNIFLFDFMGSGGSEGNTTTIGYKEAEQVKTAFDYLVKEGEKNIYLFGTSMGAVAIMKAIQDYKLTPKGIIIECPFGTMYQTVAARFRNMHVPAFPMAGLLVFWGGVQNGYWAYNHNPVDYAKSINCPTLLLYGEQDKNVSPQETETIYQNLAGPKQMRTYKDAGHESYLIHYREKWTEDITEFLSSLEGDENKE